MNDNGEYQFPAINSVFYRNFCDTRQNTHFEDIWTSNTHISDMIVRNFTHPKLTFTCPT